MSKTEYLAGMRQSQTETTTVIAISVGVGSAVFVAILITIAVVLQKKLQKKQFPEAKMKTDKKYDFDETEDGGHRRGAKSKKYQRTAGTQTPHSKSTQTSIAHKHSVFYTRSSKPSQFQHSPWPTIPRVINYQPLYAGEVKEAKPKPSPLSEEEKEAIITDLKKNYPTKPIPVLVISEPKEMERERAYSGNWQTDKPQVNKPAASPKPTDEAIYAKPRKKSLDSRSTEKIIDFGEQTWNRRVEEVLKNLDEDIANLACEAGKTTIPRPVIQL